LGPKRIKVMTLTFRRSRDHSIRHRTSFLIGGPLDTSLSLAVFEILGYKRIGKLN